MGCGGVTSSLAFLLGDADSAKDVTDGHVCRKGATSSACHSVQFVTSTTKNRERERERGKKKKKSPPH